ncbi:pyrroloquinoline-quinone synthase PqqC [Methylocaldum szegediense]|uniref:Pyrroloquinoline-quinone synthase n=1 Tax=Methylocaldum szegediense TaxID=73780 RepID=A0ABN8XCQ7_9GAMM|nr:pyrroloquinoline-quinone synthase PqqC [Methylocaldum szegediense]CAI8973924.1 Pyrroloquinoline-quinone synthase [Methylocaldum szegediense]
MSDSTPWTREEFEAKLRAKEAYYHIHHPYHVLMAEGKLNKEQIQGWVANRFYYQIKIPVKDAAILANCPDRETRRQWIQRIHDHDGWGEDAGGIEAWTRLGIAVGIPREELWSLKRVLPGVRFAVDAYVNFARQATWQEAACSSLTELFAPTIHKQRLSGWPDLYPWIDQEGLAYFRKRVNQASRDVEHGLAITLDYFKTREQQERALEILQFKLDILWTMLDAMYLAYIENKPPYFNIKP